MNFQERRRGQRIPLDSVLLSFLGSREEEQVCFEYLPLDVSPHSLVLPSPIGWSTGSACKKVT
jgi:hypothetical protein